MNPHVVVIGGGFAGASAAAALTEANHQVTLLEQRSVLGGRTSSLRDGVRKEELDNGQHLFMGCYHDTRRFLRRLGVEKRLKFLPSLQVPFVSPGGKQSLLKCPKLPSFWGFLTGMMGFQELSVTGQLALLWGLARFRLNRGKGLESLTVTQWLDRLRQPKSVRRAFWHPLCLATLNERPETACAQALAVVLGEAFLKGGQDGSLGYSTVALGKLWSVEFSAYLKRLGGKVAYNQAVKGFRVEGNKVTGVELEGGDVVDTEAVISSVPLNVFLKICPTPIKKHFRPLETASYSAIVSINLWFKKPIFDQLFVGMLDTNIQWAFNRHRLWEGKGTMPGYISLVLSSGVAYSWMTKDSLIAMAIRELKSCFPHCQEDPVHANVVWEKRATPSMSPLLWGMRPSIKTPLENFFLAGDWVDTGLPATIESACRSGHRAAEALEKYLKEKKSEGGSDRPTAPLAVG